MGKRGSIGVSNSPLSPSGPANLGTTPSSAGASTAGRSRILASRQGSDITRLPTVTLPAHRQCEVFDAFLGVPRRPKSPLVAQPRGIHQRSASARIPARPVSAAAPKRARPGAADDRAPQRGGDLPKRRRAWGGEINWAAVRFQRPGSRGPSSRSASSRWTTCIWRSADPSGNAGSASSRRTQLSTPRPRIERGADRDPFGVGVRQHFFDTGLVRPSADDRSYRVVLGLCRVFPAVDVRRRRENDAPGPGFGHRLQDVARAVDIDLMADPVVGAGTFRPCAMRDDVRAGDGAFDRGCSRISAATKSAALDQLSGR